MAFTLYQENFTGSDCTGSNGDTNRTLTLTYTGNTVTIMTLVVANSHLTDSDYSIASNVITFSNNVFDAMEIFVSYAISDGVPSSSTSTYAGTAELLRFMGYTDSNKPTCFSATVLQEALDRAESEIDRYTHSKFVTASDISPGWGSQSNEKHRGKGNKDRDYFLEYGPVANVYATLSSDVAASAGTVPVTSTNGFPSSGTISLGGNKIVYTSKDSTNFKGCTGISEAAESGDECKPYVVEVSTTEAGSSPTWSVLTEDSEFDIELEAGRVHVYRDDFVLDVYSGNNPPKIPGRVRFTYYYGYDTIPGEVKRCCLMIAARELMGITVHKSHGEGSDGFNPTMVNIDETWIKNTLDAYRVIVSSNI